MNSAPSPKPAFVFLSRKRPGFNPEWGAEVEAAVRQQAGEQFPEAFFPSTKPVDDATLRAALDECRQAGADALVVLQTTMSDGRMAPVLQQQWHGPPILWATGEKPGAPKVGACSLTGAHTFGSLYAQMGVPFQFVYGMPDDPRCQRDLADAVHAARASADLANARLALIGRHAPGFLDMDVDPFVLHRVFGTQLHHLSLHEFLDRYNAIEDAAITEDLETVRAMNLPVKEEEVSDDDLAKQSRFYLALRDLAQEEDLNALALRCWSELPNLTGQWAYLALVRLVSEGFPAAMEGDANGALSCLIGERLGMGRGFLSDWLEHTDEEVTLWHPGNAPFDMMGPAGEAAGPRLAHHFNIAKPTVVENTFETGRPLTLFVFWRVGEHYRAMWVEGETLPVEHPLAGTHARFRADDGNLFDRFDDWMQAGMPHHVAVFQGRQGRRLRRFLQLKNNIHTTNG